MKVPNSVLERRDELRAVVDHHQKQLDINEFALGELEIAIEAVENQPNEAEDDLLFEESPKPQQEPTAAPSRATAAQDNKEPQQRRPKRNIKELVLEKLNSGGLWTVKEIVEATEAAKASVETALEHWQAQGLVTVTDGKWQRFPSVAQTAALAPAAAPTTASAPAAAPEQQQASAPDDAAMSTQDKLIAALKEAGPKGMTDDELFKVGVPYVAIMQYHRLGWMTAENGRYVLAKTAA